MDLVERAGDLKGMLVDFAMSKRFERDLSALIQDRFPGGLVTDEIELTMVLDHFALQHRLPGGGTVVEAFVAAHPELIDAEREMLLGWRDVVEGTFEVRGRDSDVLVLFNVLDELTYRARSNLGRRAFRPLKKGMMVICRLVRAGDDWMVSGHIASFPAEARNEMLAGAAEVALAHPEAVFRNHEKLVEARRILAEHHTAFVKLFGADLIVVPGDQVPGRLDEFQRYVAEQARPGGDPADKAMSAELDIPDEILDAENVAIHFFADEGVNLYPDYDLLEELFADPRLLARRRYRETLSGYLRDPDLPPEPLRRLAARDLDNTDTIFTRFLKRKRGFRWEEHGEALLRRNKPGYFEGPPLPRTVPLPKPLTDALSRRR